MKRFRYLDWFFRLWIFGLCVLLGISLVAQDAPTQDAASQPTAASLADSHREFIEKNRSLLTFGLDRVEALQVPVAQRPLWQYVATLFYVLLAFYLAKLVDWLIHTRLRKLAAQTAAQWDDILVNLVDGPVKIVVFVILLNVGLQLFDWPEVLERWIAKLTILAVGISLLIVVLKTVDAAILLWRRRLPEGGDRNFNENFLILVGKVIKGILAVVAVFTVLGNLGFDIRTALASVSVMGLALGLAAQDTVGNLFGAVAVFLDKPFKIGDRVTIGEVDGTVEEMGIRSTRIRSLDGYLVTIPNKDVGNSRIVNIARRPTIRATFSLGLARDTPAPQVKQAVELVESICREHPQTQDVIVYFGRFGDFSLYIDVVYWCRQTDWRQYTKTLQAINLRLKERFDAEGLKFAFPTQTLFMNPIPEGPPPGATAGLT